MDKIRIASRAILVGMCIFGDFKVCDLLKSQFETKNQYYCTFIVLLVVCLLSIIDWGGYTTKKSSGGGGGGAK